MIDLPLSFVDLLILAVGTTVKGKMSAIVTVTVAVTVAAVAVCLRALLYYFY